MHVSYIFYMLCLVTVWGGGGLSDLATRTLLLPAASSFYDIYFDPEKIGHTLPAAPSHLDDFNSHVASSLNSSLASLSAICSPPVTRQKRGILDFLGIASLSQVKMETERNRRLNFSMSLMSSTLQNLRTSLLTFVNEEDENLKSLKRMFTHHADILHRLSLLNHLHDLEVELDALYTLLRTGHSSHIALTPGAGSTIWLTNITCVASTLIVSTVVSYPLPTPALISKLPQGAAFLVQAEDLYTAVTDIDDIHKLGCIWSPSPPVKPPLHNCRLPRNDDSPQCFTAQNQYVGCAVEGGEGRREIRKLKILPRKTRNIAATPIPSEDEALQLHIPDIHLQDIELPPSHLPAPMDPTLLYISLGLAGSAVLLSALTMFLYIKYVCICRAVNPLDLIPAVAGPVN